MSAFLRSAGWGVALLAFSLVAAVTLVPGIGLSPLVVVGQSMEPTIANGSLILIGPVRADEVRVGDVITFVAYERLLTHRVIEVRPGKQPAFVTRGDGNLRNDPRLVKPEQLRGRLVTALPWLGHGYTYLGAGMNALLLLPLVGMIVARLWELFGTLLGPAERQQLGRTG